MAIVFLWSITEVHGVGAEGAIPGDTEEAGAGEGAIGVDAVCELMAGLVLYTLALVDVGARLDGQLRLVLVLYHPLVAPVARTMKRTWGIHAVHV